MKNKNRSRSRTEGIQFFLDKSKPAIDQCVSFLRPLLQMLGLLEEQGFDVLDYQDTYAQLKFFLERLKNASQTSPNFNHTEDTLLYLVVVLERCVSFMQLTLASPNTLAELSRRYYLNLYFVQIRIECISAANRNDAGYTDEEQRESDRALLAQLTVPDAAGIWQTFVNKCSQPATVAWDNFFKNYEAFLLQQASATGQVLMISPVEETILRKLITRTGIPYVTPYNFNQFLLSFDGGRVSANAYLNAIKHWNEPGFFPFLSEVDAIKFLSTEPVGTFITTLSCKSDCYMCLFVVLKPGEVSYWTIAKKENEYIAVCKASTTFPTGDVTTSKKLNVLMSICHARTAYTNPGLRESFFGSISQQEAVALLSPACSGTFLVYHDELSFLRISYKNADVVDHIRLELTSSSQYCVCGQSNAGLSLAGSFASISAFIKAHASILKFNFDFDGVPEVMIVPHTDPTSVELLPSDRMDQGSYVHYKNCVAVETTGGYPAGTKGAQILCDRFMVRIIGDRTFFVLADGCNWGERPRAAAQKACQGYLDYICDPGLLEANTTLEYRELVMRGIRQAHLEIIKGVHPAEQRDCGKTTLLAGVVVPLDLHCKGEWGVIFASVGDCKLFLWNEENGAIDVTFGNRMHTRDASDSGGRVGPYVDGNQPDLRNLRTYFCAMTPEDVIFAVSDGVYDNLDPECLGLTPQQANIPDYASWSDIPPELLNNYKSHVFCIGLNNLLSKCKEKTPYAFSHMMVYNSLATTHKTRTFMETHPNELEPKNYAEFPGKMDHVTSIAIAPGFSLVRQDQQAVQAQVVQAKRQLMSAQKKGKLARTPTTPLKDKDSGQVQHPMLIDLKRHTKKNFPRATLWKPSKKTLYGTYKPQEDINIFGPSADEINQSMANVCAFACSTLPTERTNFSEFYGLDSNRLRTVFGMSTATNYSPSSTAAAQLCLSNFINSAALLEKKDTLEIAEALIDIVDEVNSSILYQAKKGPAECYTNGMHTATLVGGVCVRHMDDYAAKVGPGKNSSIVLIAVGNCKAFYWDVVAQELVDLTPHNDASDVGCLGPFSLSGDEPNLCNINLYTLPCAEGGVVLVLSAGILHNLDPANLGDETAKAARDALAEVVEEHSRVGIMANLERLLKSSKACSTADFTKLIYDHVVNVTSARSGYHVLNGMAPKRRTDDCPGVLGHMTCLAFRVGLTGDVAMTPLASYLPMSVSTPSARPKPGFYVGCTLKTKEEQQQANTSSTGSSPKLSSSSHKPGSQRGSHTKVMKFDVTNEKKKRKPLISDTFSETDLHVKGSSELSAGSDSSSSLLLSTGTQASHSFLDLEEEKFFGSPRAAEKAHRLALNMHGVGASENEKLASPSSSSASTSSSTTTTQTASTSPVLSPRGLTTTILDLTHVRTQPGVQSPNSLSASSPNPSSHQHATTPSSHARSASSASASAALAAREKERQERHGEQVTDSSGERSTTSHSSYSGSAGSNHAVSKRVPEPIAHVPTLGDERAHLKESLSDMISSVLNPYSPRSREAAEQARLAAQERQIGETPVQERALSTSNPSTMRASKDQAESNTGGLNSNGHAKLEAGGEKESLASLTGSGGKSSARVQVGTEAKQEPAEVAAYSNSESTDDSPVLVNLSTRARLKAAMKK